MYGIPFLIVTIVIYHYWSIISGKQMIHFWMIVMCRPGLPTIVIFVSMAYLGAQKL